MATDTGRLDSTSLHRLVPLTEDTERGGMESPVVTKDGGVVERETTGFSGKETFQHVGLAHLDALGIVCRPSVQ